MNDFTLETVDLTHRFGADMALDDVCLRVPPGAIYGFLGPNGAGKTTTLRLVLGLLRRQSGRIEIFGRDFDANRVELLRRMGTIIESPSIYGHLTARENLRVHQLVRRCSDADVDDALRLVGLGDTGRKRAANFSLGMKQRLSIAIALLDRPELLILDEPTNGLDPNGIVEMRELLRGLNRERGTTILVSSHLLDEIERLVTHVGVISRGRLRFQGTLAELVERRRQTAFFATSDDRAAIEALTAGGLEVSAAENGFALDAADDAAVARACRTVVGANIDIYAVERGGSDLESDFFRLTGE